MRRYDEEAEDLSSTGGESPRRVIGPLNELNYQCLDLLARQASVCAAHTFPLAEAAQGWRALDEPARRRAADYPFLLFDAGFADPRRWQQLDEPRVSDAENSAYAAFFTVPDAVAVARLVFVFAWSMTRHHRTHARLALGMHPHCVRVIAEHSVLHVHQMAEHWWTWLQPRWPQKPQIWQELLAAGAEGGEAHLRARMHGMQLLAADTAAALRNRGKGSGR